MLSSQRELFDIPGDVCFLNAASYSPLPLATLDAGRKAVARKGRPWLIDHAFASKQYERARNAAARLINADPEDVALISSVGYGVAAAAKILPVPTRSRVLVLQDDHSSPVLEWMTRAGAGDCCISQQAVFATRHGRRSSPPALRPRSKLRRAAHLRSPLWRRSQMCGNSISPASTVGLLRPSAP